MAPKGTRLVSWSFLHPWKRRLPQCTFYSTRSISTSFRLLASRNFPKAGQLSLHDSAILWHSVCAAGLSPMLLPIYQALSVWVDQWDRLTEWYIECIETWHVRSRLWCGERAASPKKGRKGIPVFMMVEDQSPVWEVTVVRERAISWDSMWVRRI